MCESIRIIYSDPATSRRLMKSVVLLLKVSWFAGSQIIMVRSTSSTFHQRKISCCPNSLAATTNHCVLPTCASSALVLILSRIQCVLVVGRGAALELVGSHSRGWMDVVWLNMKWVHSILQVCSDLGLTWKYHFRQTWPVHPFNRGGAAGNRCLVFVTFSCPHRCMPEPSS